MDEVGPSDVARLDAQRVAGILTARGGATSHSAIIARALGIPALVGAGAAVLGLEPGTALLLDGEQGQMTVAPDVQALHAAETQRDLRQRRATQAEARRHEPAGTRDGHAVEVCANLGDTAGAAHAVELGAEGVGLLRTEFVFMDNPQAPDLATQEAEYRRVLDALDGRPLVARTLDVGGDKPLPYWPIPQETNPYLGLRGVRLTLQRPQILRTQLRALLSARRRGRPLRMMFPMVGSVEEWRQARDLAPRNLREEIPLADLQLGIMVEVPSAALLAPVLAREVDFFSVGTNDLTQYTLAIDRGHPSLSAQADGLHPAVLQLIDMTVRAAHAQGKWVGVCGELAADPLALPLLVGLGVDELSVSARSIPLVKARRARAGPADIPRAGSRGIGPVLGSGRAPERPGPGAGGGALMARILTLTLNPALDLTVRLRELAPGEVNRSEAVLTQAAGKGLNVAQVLADLGHPLTVAGFLGEDNAPPFAALFRRRGFADAFVRVPGETRRNIKMAEGAGRITDLNGPGPAVSGASQQAALLDRLDRLAGELDLAVVAGSLPRGVEPQWLRELLRRLRGLGLKVAFDSSGAALRAGVEAAPWLIKPNVQELADPCSESPLAALMSWARRSNHCVRAVSSRW